MPQLWGILNLTGDSFSDGGKFLATEAAIAHGEQLMAEGAHGLDVGAESSNPQGQRVPLAAQLERLTPVLRHFIQARVPLSVDTHQPEVMAAALALGVEMVNDITALRDPAAVRLLAGSQAKVVLMFARNAQARAEVKVQPHAALLAEEFDFFSGRIAALEEGGIDRARLLVDPGMGFFLGANPEPSLFMLKHLRSLKSLGCPLYVCTSRKSFIGATLGGLPVSERGAGTLATELWAAAAGVDCLRTHEVKPLAQALRMWRAIEQVE